MKAIGYCRISKDEAGRDAHGLDAQRHTLTAEARRRGWDLRLIVDAGVSGGVAPDARAALGPALAALDKGEAGALIISRLDRLGRSLANVAALLDRAQRKGWIIVTTDQMGLDMDSPSGRLVAGVLASAAEFERQLLRQRTREGLAAAKAKGVRLGRERQASPQVVERILAASRDGESGASIARALEADGIAAPNGGQRWHPSSVHRLLASEARAKASV